MFMKLTPGVNFMNIFRTNFSYERGFGSFSLLTFLVTFLLWGKIHTKTCVYCEIDTCRQFHQLVYEHLSRAQIQKVQKDTKQLD